jgi:predicted outer membrane protein
MNVNWKSIAFGVAGGFAFLALPVYSQTVYSRPDRGPMILLRIHRADQNQIEIAKLAKDNSSSQEVKDFADQIIKDHQSADDQVQAYATNHKVDLDALHRRLLRASDERLELERRARTIGSATGEWAWTWEDSLRSTKSKRQAALEKLRKLQGAEFDREFTRAMVESHQAAIERLNSARVDTLDPEMRNLVEELLPTFEQDLSLAQKLRDAISKS